MSVQPDKITARVSAPGIGWTEIGSVANDGGNFTDDKVGFYVPGNDEIAIANFRFAPHP